MSESLGTFDSIATLYDESLPAHVSAHYLDKRLRFIDSLFPVPSRLLDVGCGTGTLARRVAASGHRVFGVDPSQGMLGVAHAKGVVALRTTALALPFADASFDGVYCIAVLHHLAAPLAVLGAIREMIRVTRPGGAVLLWDHNPLNPYWPLLMRRVPQDDGSERLIGRGEILSAVRSTGATAMAAHRSGFVPDFVPPRLLPFARRTEARLERWRLTRWAAAHNVVVVRKER